MTKVIDPHIFEFPLSLILALAFVLCVFVIRNGTAGKFLVSRPLSVILMVLSAVFLAAEGTWSPGLQHHRIFILVLLILMTFLGLTAVRDSRKGYFLPMMSHLGLFLVLFGGLFGAPDFTEVQMRVFSNGRQENMAYDITLQEFRIDFYDDGVSPKQYTSILTADGRTLQTSVNHPCRYNGCLIYQTGYDKDNGDWSALKIVRDPWLPLVALGALLLALASFLSLKTIWNSWKMLAAAIALAVVFGAVSVARINFGTLAPALRSFWFVPHLAAYMLAYSFLTISAIAGIASLFSRKIPEGLSGKLLSTASSLLLIGMLCGAVWAKQAWGDYWTWDAKECWAAATWLLTLAGTHIRKKKAALVFTVLAFLAIQMTWYGVNYLPSSYQSLHIYNQ